MKKHYFIQLSYDGTQYHGWQVQPNAITVQELLTATLEKLFQHKTSITGAGRTDTGVHARFFIAHFDAELPFSTITLVQKLNKMLPKDIAVQKVFAVKDDAHARFDAVSRTYRYYIDKCKNPFTNRFAASLKSEISIAKMQESAQLLPDYENFKTFSKKHTDVKNHNCNIYKAEWQETAGQYIFTIKANRFLRNMVRAIVGTLIEVGREKISVEDFRNIIESKDRSQAGTSAPAQGLFLEEVEY